VSDTTGAVLPAPQDELAQAHAVVAAMRSGAPVTPELVNRYYTLCIPFYREFLGEHWHTGFYCSLMDCSCWARRPSPGRSRSAASWLARRERHDSRNDF